MNMRRLEVTGDAVTGRRLRYVAGVQTHGECRYEVIAGRPQYGVCGLCDAIERHVPRGRQACSIVVYRTGAEIMNSRTRRTRWAYTVVIQIQRKRVAASGTTTTEHQTSPPSSRSRRLPIVDGVLRRIRLQRVKGVRV